jgi:prophage regulatory protein
MQKPNKLIRIKSVLEMTSISRSYLYQLVSKGDFPKPVQLVHGGKSVAWIEAEVQSWVESRIQARDESMQEACG